MGTNPEPRDAFARVRLAYSATYVLLPIIIVTAAVLKDPLPRLFGFFLVGYLIAALIVMLSLCFWPCPHCGKAFFGGWRHTWKQSWDFSRSKAGCANCGLMWEGTSRSRAGAA